MPIVIPPEQGRLIDFVDFATGRPGRLSGIYDKSVPRLPCVIAYVLSERADRERVVILRVIHVAGVAGRGLALSSPSAFTVC